MRTIIFLLILLLSVTACGPAPNIAAITPPYIETGIDADAWATVPAGDFPYGQHDHMTPVDYDYEIMVTLVTNEQFAAFLNEALAADVASLGTVEVEGPPPVVAAKPADVGTAESADKADKPA